MEHPENVVAHEQHHRLDETVWYPPHPKRTESPLFHHNKKLIHEEDRPCFICGARRSEGAEIEVHHTLEWAFEAGLDMDKVARDFGVDDIEDIRMLMTLCKKHHRGHGTGIHNISYPVWIAQKYAKPGVSFTQHEMLALHNQSKE